MVKFWVLNLIDWPAALNNAPDVFLIVEFAFGESVQLQVISNGATMRLGRFYCLHVDGVYDAILF